MKKQIFVSGHRNPDVDSLASAVGLAELRRRQGMTEVRAVCPGMLPDRGRFLFEKFHIEPPVSRNDVYPRVEDIMEDSEVIPGGLTLYEGVQQLRKSGLPRLPVAAADGSYLGMLSPMLLLSSLLNLDNSRNGLAGREVFSSIDLIRRSLRAEVLVADQPELEQEFQVYVAAMGPDSFDEHLPKDNPRSQILIVGDRSEIHLRALHRGIRLMIVTGDRPVDPLIIKEAALQRVSVLQTPFDSAKASRLVKFSSPVAKTPFAESALKLTPSDRLRDVRSQVLNQQEDVIPVVGDDGRLCGIVLKKAFNQPPPSRMILVDHNEIDQSLPGVEEVPIIEVVDHHRIGMAPTSSPIKFTGDIVGSTCTLVAAMFRSSGESLTPALAGLLLAGVVTDTLMLKSPTTSPLDRRICEWLEKISGISGADLMAELMQINSPLAVKSASDVINGDRKDYHDGRYHFALAQVEETNLELLHQRKTELMEQMEKELQQNKLSFFGLLVTDAVRENSELLYLGAEEVRRNLPYQALEENLLALPGVLSRKKQLLPQILAITAALQ